MSKKTLSIPIDLLDRVVRYLESFKVCPGSNGYEADIDSIIAQLQGEPLGESPRT